MRRNRLKRRIFRSILRDSGEHFSPLAANSELSASIYPEIPSVFGQRKSAPEEQYFSRLDAAARVRAFLHFAKGKSYFPLMLLDGMHIYYSRAGGGDSPSRRFQRLCRARFSPFSPNFRQYRKELRSKLLEAGRSFVRSRSRWARWIRNCPSERREHDSFLIREHFLRTRALGGANIFYTVKREREREMGEREEESLLSTNWIIVGLI